MALSALAFEKIPPVQLPLLLMYNGDRAFVCQVFKSSALLTPKHRGKPHNRTELAFSQSPPSLKPIPSLKKHRRTRMTDAMAAGEDEVGKESGDWCASGSGASSGDQCVCPPALLAPTPVEAAARQLFPAAVEAGYSAPVPELRTQPDEAVEAGGSVGAIVV
jgi:hypothetical protein